MDKPEFLKQFWDVLEQDSMVMSFYSRSDWEKIINAFFDYTPLFADNVFEGVNDFDQVSRDDNISDLISEITSPDAGIDLAQNPPFSTAYFSQYLTLPESLERPLGQPQAPLLKPKPQVSPKPKATKESENTPKIQPISTPEVEKAIIAETKSETVPPVSTLQKDTDEPIPNVKLEPKFETSDVPEIEDEPEDEPIPDKGYETSLEDDFDSLNTPAQSTTEFLARKEADEENQISSAFGDFEILYRNQMLSIMASHDEMAAMRILLYGVNLTEFKLDEINPEVKIALVDGLLNRYDSRIDSGEFDPREYLAWSDLDAGYVDNPSTFPGLIERDLKEIMQVVYDDLT